MVSLAGCHKSKLWLCTIMLKMLKDKMVKTAFQYLKMLIYVKGVKENKNKIAIQFFKMHINVKIVSKLNSLTA